MTLESYDGYNVTSFCPMWCKNFMAKSKQVQEEPHLKKNLFANSNDQIDYVLTKQIHCLNFYTSIMQHVPDHMSIYFPGNIPHLVSIFLILFQLFKLTSVLLNHMSMRWLIYVDLLSVLKCAMFDFFFGAGFSLFGFVFKMIFKMFV